MGAACSLDLGQRVWSALRAGEGTEAQVAGRFRVSLSFARFSGVTGEADWQRGTKASRWRASTGP